MTKRIIGIVGLVLCIVLLFAGIFTHVPARKIPYNGSGAAYEYVGGDAYNYMIEASLRGGEISGAMTAKAVYFSASAMLLLASLLLVLSEPLPAGLDEKLKGTFKGIQDKVKQQVSDMKDKKTVQQPPVPPTAGPASAAQYEQTVMNNGADMNRTVMNPSPAVPGVQQAMGGPAPVDPWNKGPYTQVNIVPPQNPGYPQAAPQAIPQANPQTNPQVKPQGAPVFPQNSPVFPQNGQGPSQKP